MPLGPMHLLPGPHADDVGAALVHRWRSGDRTAFTAIFNSYRGLVVRVLSRLLPKDADIEDAVQATFVEVFRSLASFEGRSRLSSWIVRLALRAGYRQLRKRRGSDDRALRAEIVLELVDESPRSDPAHGLLAQELMQRVQLILLALAPKKRTAFILNDLEGLPQEQVAEIVGCNIKTLRTRLFHARREFWKQAKKDDVLCRFMSAEPRHSQNQ